MLEFCNYDNQGCSSQIMVSTYNRNVVLNYLNNKASRLLIILIIMKNYVFKKVINSQWILPGDSTVRESLTIERKRKKVLAQQFDLVWEIALSPWTACEWGHTKTVHCLFKR